MRPSTTTIIDSKKRPEERRDPRKVPGPLWTKHSARGPRSQARKDTPDTARTAPSVVVSKNEMSECDKNVEMVLQVQAGRASEKGLHEQAAVETAFASQHWIS